MEDVPVPRPELTAEAPAAGASHSGAPIPDDVTALCRTLWSAGHAAYVVGGSLRDVLLGRPPRDWDLTTDALPEEIQGLFPASFYENRFGTVTVRREGVEYQITTFRRDHDYADFRRPHRVEFGVSIDEDLARRDFTMNAIAWGARPEPGATPPTDFEPAPVDPYGGAADVAARRLRAVGDPLKQFEEDALRMIRAVRLAATLDFTIDDETLAAIAAKADLAGHLSGERIAAEFWKLLEAPHPSPGLRLMEKTGLLIVVAPELARQVGIPQNKVPGEDLWGHVLRAVDAAPIERPIVRLAALLHDVGKPAAMSEAGFPAHDVEGAKIARKLLERLRVARSIQDRVVFLVAQHMFSYEPAWTDAAVRQFIGKIGEAGDQALDELLELREADNVGSGLPRETGLEELRRRVTEQLEANVPLTRADLAIDGNDLIAELGLEPGPMLGRLLEQLLDRVIVDSDLNDRPTLLMLAQGMLADRD